MDIHYFFRRIGVGRQMGSSRFDYILLKMFACGGDIGGFFLLGNDSVLGNPIARNAASVSFCVTVLSLLKQMDIDSQLVYSFACIGISLTIAFALHKIIFFGRACRKKQK